MDDEMASSITSASEYSDAVYQWMLQVHQWQNLAKAFPAYLAYQSARVACSQRQTRQRPTQNGTPNVTNERQTTPLNWREFRVPPLWKRVAAESVDFLILTVVKLVLTHVAVDHLEVLRWETIYLTDDQSSYVTTLDATAEFFIFEFIYKLVVITFEAAFTYARSRRGPGGATPGKLLMGIKILSCNHVVTTGDHVVQIVPAEDLGASKAIVRSLMKNFVSTFLFPSWVAVFFSPQLRAMHDIVAKTIVVEDQPRA